MQGFTRFLAEIFSGLVILASAGGIAFLLLGALIVVEANTGESKSVAQGLISADLWARKLQVWMYLGPGKWLGTYSLAFGLKLLAGAVASGVILDIMYSLRTIAEQRRR